MFPAFDLRAGAAASVRVSADDARALYDALGEAYGFAPAAPAPSSYPIAEALRAEATLAAAEEGIEIEPGGPFLPVLTGERALVALRRLIDREHRRMDFEENPA